MRYGQCALPPREANGLKSLFIIQKGNYMDLIAISTEEYLKKLNEALGEEYLDMGYRFFASPNRLSPGRIDWLRNEKTDPIFIEALQKVEAVYRPIIDDINPDNVGSPDSQI
jgi:hypothetical protein